MSNTNKLLQTAEAVEKKAIENTIATVDKVQDFVNQGIQKAFEKGESVKAKAIQACDKTADCVREQPIKSVVAAGLAGAALAYIATSIAKRKTA